MAKKCSQMYLLQASRTHEINSVNSDYQESVLTYERKMHDAGPGLEIMHNSAHALQPEAKYLRPRR
jgi:hypothetical protein